MFKHSKFQLKSKWQGPIGPPALEAFAASNLSAFNNRPEYKAPRQQNLTKNEFKSLRVLGDDTNIVIKPADKGAAIVVIDRVDYLKEGYRQLSDSNFYSHQEHDLTERHMKEVSNRVEDMFQDGEIDVSVKLYLQDGQCKTAGFYLLPKIHKIK